MFPRRVIAVLALLGVLLHSAAVVRHHALMTARLSEAALVAMLSELGVICHTETAQDNQSGTAAGDGRSAPGNAGQSCPICSGLASLFLISPPAGPIVALSLPLGAAYDPEPDQRITQFKRIRPPGRGPPSLA